MANTLMAALELAHTGDVDLKQAAAFEPITVRATAATPDHAPSLGP